MAKKQIIKKKPMPPKPHRDDSPEIKKLHDALAKMQGILDDKTQELSRMAITAIERAETINEKSAECDRLKDDLINTRQELDNYEGEITQLRADNARLKSSLINEKKMLAGVLLGVQAAAGQIKPVSFEDFS